MAYKIGKNTLGKNLPEKVILPSIYEGEEVTTIAAQGFQVESADNGNKVAATMKEIVIPESITTIEANAFDGCTGLEEVTIPVSVTSMGANVFNGCTKLDKIKVLGATTGWPNNWNGSATIDQQKYKITTNIKGSGTITVLNESVAGSEIAVTVLANEGYQFKSIDFSVDSFNGSNGSYTFIMPAKPVVISVIFEKIVLQDAYFFYGDALQSDVVITQENGAYCLEIDYFGTDYPATLYSDKPISKVQAYVNGDWYDEEGWECSDEKVSVNINSTIMSKYETKYNGSGGAGGDLISYRFVFGG